jgi:integrase
MARPAAPRQRTRGSVDTLPSGALRVRVYAGVDALTGKQNYLVKIIPPGPGAAAVAEQTRTRFLNQIDERRSVRTRATLDQLLDKWLQVAKLEGTTLNGYESKLRRHVRPALGKKQLGKIDVETLETFYGSLARCRARCNGRKFIEHRMAKDHECTEKCRPHVCKPLADSTIRQIHWILSGALDRAVRWRWIGVNPCDEAEPPPQPKPNPRPPSPAEAGELLTEASKDIDWGTLVWTAITTGARRGELCALRWIDIDFDNAVVMLTRSIAQVGGRCWEKNLKSHQQRRITLDPETLEVARAHRQRCEERALALGVGLSKHAFVFSLVPDGSRHLKPDSVTQRYDRMAKRLEIVTTIHNLRHYSATELIRAGVDIRTVAGRLGHGGGGATTLRVYSAWSSESDQRAAAALVARLPRLPRPDAPQAS